MNPHHVRKLKEPDDNNPNKIDRKDPKTIAALVNEGHFSYPYILISIYVDIRSLGVEGVNQIWREAKLRGAERRKRAKTLVLAAGHSVGSKEAARYELKNLLEDMDTYTVRIEELLGSIEELLKEIPYVDKLMEIKGAVWQQSVDLSQRWVTWTF